MSGRRELLRTSLLASIREAALAELRRTSPSELSLREVARVAGLSPSGMYRYFDGRDALLEMLVADGFERFGEAINEAISAAKPTLQARAHALATAYLGWARANPEQFALILGSPVVGFAASPNGPTEVAVRRFGLPMIRMMVDAYGSGELAVDKTSMVDISDFSSELGEVPANLIEIAVRSWGRIHGLVILDGFGHLRWSGTSVERLLAEEVDSIVKGFGPVTKPSARRSR